jgi:hypothetical protein
MRGYGRVDGGELIKAEGRQAESENSPVAPRAKRAFTTGCGVWWLAGVRSDDDDGGASHRDAAMRCAAPYFWRVNGVLAGGHVKLSSRRLRLSTQPPTLNPVPLHRIPLTFLNSHSQRISLTQHRPPKCRRTAHPSAPENNTLLASPPAQPIPLALPTAASSPPGGGLVNGHALDLIGVAADIWYCKRPHATPTTDMYTAAGHGKRQRWSGLSPY